MGGLRGSFDRRRATAGERDAADAVVERSLGWFGVGTSGSIAASPGCLGSSIRSTTLFLAQAIDRTKGPTELTEEQSLTALQVANMNKTQYLMGICPLYEGMAARISCI